MLRHVKLYLEYFNYKIMEEIHCECCHSMAFYGYIIFKWIYVRSHINLLLECLSGTNYIAKW
jgi:hypothetical protein